MSESRSAILVVATGWGPKFGGINSFNRDFCLALGKKVFDEKLNYDVVCMVMCGVSDKEGRDAHESHVKLLGLNLEGANAFLDGAASGLMITNRLEEVGYPSESVKHVVLHDLSTGGLMTVKRHLFLEAKWTAFHHMHYKEYEQLKGVDKNLGRIAKTIKQNELFKNADYVFAVGPLLSSLLERELVGKGHEVGVTQCIPGLKVRQLEHNPGVTINALTYGRLDHFHDSIKLASLAMDAWIREIPIYRKYYLDLKGEEPGNLRDSKLKIVGFDFQNEIDKERCEKLLAEHGGLVDPFPYTEKSDILDYFLADSTLALMLSRHEGFGLTGWEAIGAGIPLILTKNSGLWMLLEQHKLESYVWGIDLRRDYTQANGNHYTQDEVELVQKAIRQYFCHSQEWHKRANDLQQHLGNMFTWERTAQSFLAGVKAHNHVREARGVAELAENPDSLSIPDFAKRSVEHCHALILSHKTNIIEMQDAQTYAMFRHFLNRFTDDNKSISGVNSGLRMTLLIFVVDFGGKYDGGFEEQALYNCITLQSAFKAIFLVPPFGHNRLITGEKSQNEIVETSFPEFKYKKRHEEFLSHYSLLRSLSNRVVVLAKNYEQYLDGIGEADKYGTSELSGFNYTRFMPERKETTDRVTAGLNTDFVLLQQMPDLSYLGQTIQTYLEKECTNIRKQDDKAFGLYSTVRFDDFNKGGIGEVKCFMIDRGQNVSDLKLDRTRYVGHRESLFEDGIKKSMSIVAMSAGFFLNQTHWSNEIRTKFWPDQAMRVRGFEEAYQQIEGNGFHHFTLPQFLNIPIIFPEIVEENLARQSHEGLGE
jgi:glycosyltransferase involved in cell wall biosynthesis